MNGTSRTELKATIQIQFKMISELEAKLQAAEERCAEFELGFLNAVSRAEAAEAKNAELAILYATPCDPTFDSWITEANHFRSRAEAATRLQAEVARLRKIAAQVPAKEYIKAKEAAGFGVEVKAMEVG